MLLLPRYSQVPVATDFRLGLFFKLYKHGKHCRPTTSVDGRQLKHESASTFHFPFDRIQTKKHEKLES